MSIDQETVGIFCREIWSWYRRHKRQLPWRDLQVADSDQRAYLILVSEMMLQQTQVSRVIIKYKEFVQRFPDTKALSHATNADVLIAWRGMGYNSRALRLRDAACVIVDRFEGRFPMSMKDLRSIKGIGEYTAGAIRNFAFGIPTPCIDTNIRRILHRFFIGPENADGRWKAGDGELLEIARRVLDVALETGKRNQGNQRVQRNQRTSLDSLISSVSLDSSSWHAALMDFGSLVMTKTSPKWELLSPGLRSICKAYGKQIKRTKKLNKKEPGRMVAGRIIPRRITRGKIIEALRDHEAGLSLTALGPHAALDWSMGDHQVWLRDILRSLEREGLIEHSGALFRLSGS